MPRSGIEIEDYKREVFERRLKEAGFSFTTMKGIVDGTLLLVVDSSIALFPELQRVVRAANEEARYARQPMPRRKH